MSSEVRVRYAPSPTGEPHLGNIRTAVFNWLFARHHDGAFVIRIEDTDRARRVEGATEVLLDALRWLGLDWDEGPDIGGANEPYAQSDRLDLYRRSVDQLLDSGSAYRCYCSTERLAEIRERQQKRKEDPGYDRRCRDLSEDERLQAKRSGAKAVVRFKMPLDGVTTLHDIIRDEVRFENRLVDDFVMLKSDGFPTYHLANVVDDHVMEISHVLRAEEWLPSTPRHLQIYRAFDWEPPRFAHLPIILAPDRSKLSKRHGATSILEYRSMGFLPHAMVNFLTFLGWSLDDRTEVMSVDELVRHFSIERVSKAGAIFDVEKLTWMNGHYIRQQGVEQLADDLLAYWRAYPPLEIPSLPNREFLLRIVPLIQERMKVMGDAAPLIKFFFQDSVEYETDELVQKGLDAPTTRGMLEQALAGLSALPSFDLASIEGFLRPLAERLDVKPRQLFGSLRVATTGLRVSPPLFETMEVLGGERTLLAIRNAVDRLSEE